jgi:tetratricopeptide (TPR) repeat protein
MGTPNLAVVSKIKGRYDEAVSYYHKAHQSLPTLPPLLVEYCESLLAANRPDEMLALIDSLPKQIANHSRVRLLEAKAGLALDLPDRCRPILRDDYELVDIREGETSLTDMWLALQSSRRGVDNDPVLVNDSTKSLDSQPRLPSGLNFQVVPHPHLGVFPHQHARRHDPVPEVGLR